MHDFKTKIMFLLINKFEGYVKGVSDIKKNPKKLGKISNCLDIISLYLPSMYEMPLGRVIAFIVLQTDTFSFL